MLSAKAFYNYANEVSRIIMIVKTEPEQIIGYLEDASNLTFGKADKVYIPQTEEEVQHAVRECASKGTPLTISGGGTGTVGSRIPPAGAILSVERLNQILSIDAEGKRATLQAGVIVDDFLKTLDKQNLFYPPFPTERTAFIGGNIATNASGEYSYRFGPTRKYVQKIKVILSSDKRWEIKRGEFLADKDGFIQVDDFRMKIPAYESPSIKCTAGYFSQPGMDLIDLFIGSEGTLGVITEAEVSLTPALSSPFNMVVFMTEEGDPLKFLAEVKNNPELRPLSLEFFDQNSLGFLRKDFPHIPDCKCAFYLEEEQEEDSIENWLDLLEKHPVVDTWVGEDSKNYQKLIDFRHKLPENVNEHFKRLQMPKTAFDIAVPEDYFPELYTHYLRITNETKIQYVLFGHIGENHLHLNFFPKDDTEKELLQKVYQETIRKIAKVGGTISAEHGIGKMKHEYLEMMYGEEGILEMVRVKKKLDPYCILGLDNIFPQSLLK